MRLAPPRHLRPEHARHRQAGTEEKETHVGRYEAILRAVERVQRPEHASRVTTAHLSRKGGAVGYAEGSGAGDCILRIRRAGSRCRSGDDAAASVALRGDDGGAARCHVE